MVVSFESEAKKIEEDEDEEENEECCFLVHQMEGSFRGQTQSSKTTEVEWFAVGFYRVFNVKFII